MGLHKTAFEFFDACDSGKGWEVCAQFCHDNAGFSAQCGVLADIKTLEGYVDWMRDLMIPIRDGRYDLKAFSVDEERGIATVFAVFRGTNTGAGPMPPTGNTIAANYVYAMEFDGEKIKHVTKIWNDAHSLVELGWA